MLQQVFKSLYENASNSKHVKVHIKMLAAIRDVCKLVVKELTSWVCCFGLCNTEKRCLLFILKIIFIYWRCVNCCAVIESLVQVLILVEMTIEKTINNTHAMSSPIDGIWAGEDWIQT